MINFFTLAQDQKSSLMELVAAETIMSSRTYFWEMNPHSYAQKKHMSDVLWNAVS